MTMSRELLSRLDDERGLIPRATYIEHCLRQYFELRDNLVGFYDEILAMLPEKVDSEKCDKLRAAIESIRSKVRKRKKSIAP